MKAADVDTRAVMVLAHEARRMQDAAERVGLVVKAMAIRKGVTVPDGLGASTARD